MKKIIISIIVLIFLILLFPFLVLGFLLGLVYESLCFGFYIGRELLKEIYKAFNRSFHE